MESNNIYFSRGFAYSLVISAVIIFSTLTLASFQGYNAPPETAESIATEIENLRTTITWGDIFLNNFVLALITFVPFFGVLFAVYVQYNTGFALGALAQVFNVGNVEALLAILISPVGILEYSAYVLALAESTVLVYSVFKRRLRSRLFKQSWKTLAFVALLLFIGAIFEAFIIGRL